MIKLNNMDWFFISLYLLICILSFYNYGIDEPLFEIIIIPPMLFILLIIFFIFGLWLVSLIERLMVLKMD